MDATTITRLTCEYLTNPIGIDVAVPRLSWQMETDRLGARQAAYRIRVGTEPGATDLWDSGTVESDQSTHVEYDGTPLTSGQRAYWSTEITDETGITTVSELYFWEMGLREQSDWTARWIQSSLAGGPRSTVPVPYLRREFELAKPVERARLYITALGVYEARLNGERVGDAELAPGWTDYRKRLAYQTYDVAGQLQEGKNCLGAMLGDGWYCGHVEWRDRQMYGDRPKLLAQLVVTHPDGSTTTVTSDPEWQTGFGSILEADLIMGEAQDLRREPTGWDTAGFAADGWSSVAVVDIDPPLVAQNYPVMRVVDVLPAKTVSERPQWPMSKFVFDLGQNMVGRVRLRVRGEAGKTVTLRYAERLDEKGGFYTANYRGARSTDYFTLVGGGEELLEPKFTFHGFQYVEVAGVKEVALEDLEGIVIHSAWEPNGEFECSDPLVNQLQHNIQWGWKGNSLDVPTDCPQRDERLGWTGDAQVFVRTACFNADVAPFFAKYQQDLADAQNEKGQIPPIAPNTEVVGGDGGPAWADAFAICPWTIYRCYGDTRLLDTHFAALKQWVDSLDISSRDLIRSYPGYEGFSGFGDWLSTNAETPNDLIGTAFYAHVARLVSKMAFVLNRGLDGEEYARLADRVKAAFQRRYVTADGLVASGSQTAYVLALHFDLLPPQLRAAAVKNLVDDIGKRGFHLSTGFVGTPYLNSVLVEGGRADIAYKLLLQQTWPSWLYSVTQGATTIWERWDGWTHDKGFQDAGMNSFNHYAYGAIGDWLYSVVAGIELDPEVPGYKISRLQPRPGGGLTSASASLRTPYGRLSSAWSVEGDRFEWTAVVPPNTRAWATLPPEVSGGTRNGDGVDGPVELIAGTHRFQGTWGV